MRETIVKMNNRHRWLQGEREREKERERERERERGGGGGGYTRGGKDLMK